MKQRNISFAQVLKNKPRSPLPEPKYTPTRLAELLQMWQQSPQNDYTLYLGKTSNLNSQYSNSRMLTSNNLKGEEEMFDSWIQRQSSILTNKSNKTTQSHKPNQNEQYKSAQTSSKVDYNSKSKESNKGHKTIGELVRRNDNQHIENSSQYANLGNNIQMIKSKTCDNQGRREGLKSPNSRHIVQAPKLVVQEVPFQKETRQQKTNIVEDRFKERTKEANKPKISFKTVGESISKQENINDIIADTSNIHNQIADLAKKYLIDEEYESNYVPGREDPQEEQDEELLIGNSDKKPIIQEGTDEPMFSEGYSEKAKKTQELQRVRKEEAKNKINSLMKGYFSKTRRQGQPTPQREVKLDILQQQQPVVQIIPNNLSVGYSFASNHAQNSTKFQFQHRIDHIQQINSQMPSFTNTNKMQNSEDVQFRRKYIKQQNIIVPDEHIQNIQSVQYNTQRSYRQDEARVNQNAPNGSFQTKFITSQNQRQKQQRNPCFMSNQYRDYMTRQQQRHTQLDFDPPQPQPQYKNTSFSKQIKFVAPLQHNFVSQTNTAELNSHKSSIAQQFGKFPHQKIKIVSSSKNKLSSNSNKSNKSSPAASKSSDQKAVLNGAVKQVKTEPFIPVQTVQNNTDNQTFQIKSPQNTSKEQKEGCSPFKTIKQVKNSIINPSKSPETFQTTNPSKFDINLNTFQINKKQETYPTKNEPITTQYDTGLPRQKQISTYTSNYVPPSYGKTTKYQSNYSYYNTQNIASNPTYNNPTHYALPTQNSYHYQSSYVSAAQNNIYTTGNNLPSATYGEKLTSPKIYQFKQHYQTKYTTNFNSSYQTCQKFNTIIAKTQSQFPDHSNTIEYSTTTPPSYQTRSSKVQNMGKRSYLSQLDIKQSINLDDRRKGLGQSSHANIENDVRSIAMNKKQETPSLLDKAMTNSLKKSINVGASGQFQFDF